MSGAYDMLETMIIYMENTCSKPSGACQVPRTHLCMHALYISLYHIYIYIYICTSLLYCTEVYVWGVGTWV